MIIDECVSVVSASETKSLSICRELGLKYVFGFQHHEQLVTKLGDERLAMTFLNLCGTWVTFRSSAWTIENACKHMGTHMRWVPAEAPVDAAPLMKTVLAETQNGLDDQFRGRLISVVSSFTGSVTRIRRHLSLGFKAAEDDKNELRRQGTIQGTLKDMQSITTDEAIAQLTVPYTALVDATRAQAPRHEIVDFYRAEWEAKPGVTKAAPIAAPATQELLQA